MGLEQDAVDLLEFDAFGLVAHGFEQTGQTKVAGAAQEAVGGADDESESFLGKSVMSQADGVELGEDELVDLVGIEPGDNDGKGDTGLDVLVDAEVEIGQEGGLANQNQVMILGEVFQQQPQFSQAGHVHEMGVVDDGSNHHTEMVEAERFLDETLFTGEIAAIDFKAKGVAKNAQGVAVRVKGAGDGGGDEAFLVMILEGLFDDRFTGAGLAQEQAQPALLAMDAQRIEDVLLMRQQRNGVGMEGAGTQAKVRTDHKSIFKNEEALG
jgi:hypothetical protein